MTLEQAFIIVQDLAEQNVIDNKDNNAEHKKQIKALSLINKYFHKKIKDTD